MVRSHIHPKEFIRVMLIVACAARLSCSWPFTLKQDWPGLHSQLPLQLGDKMHVNWYSLPKKASWLKQPIMSVAQRVCLSVGDAVYILPTPVRCHASKNHKRIVSEFTSLRIIPTNSSSGGGVFNQQERCKFSPFMHEICQDGGAHFLPRAAARASTALPE